jgi:ADP-heptose:LPS heptosyltransferase
MLSQPRLQLRWAYQSTVLRPLWASLGRVRLKRLSALGDELMVTGVAREIKRQAPGTHVSLVCSHPELFAGNPHIDELVADDRRLEPLTFHLMYETVIARDRRAAGHLQQHFCEQLGLKRAEPRCEIFLSTEERERASAFRKKHGPFLTLQTRPGPWTPYKAWDDAGWQAVIDRWSRDFTIVHVGGDTEPRFERVTRLAGRTSLRETFEILSGATAHLGVASFLVHAANGVGRRSLVICGGYEAPGTTSYPGDEAIGTTMTCAPCWRTKGCPFDVNCMRSITPTDVNERVARLVAGTS